MADKDVHDGPERPPATPLVPPGHGEAPMRVPSARDTKIVRSSAAIALGLGIAALVLASVFKKEVPRDVPVDDGTLVQLQALTSESQELVVRAQGSVVPAKQISVHAEVSGRIEWVSPDLVPGGRLRKGAELVRIDSRDYRLRAQQASASLEQARYQLQIERSRKAVAEREWSMIGTDSIATEAGKAVALREPQLKAAEAAVEAAESAAELAQVQLARSTIRAPFACFVQTEHADVGQFVSPQQPLATLAGTDEFWVQVSVPMDDLARIKVPGWNAKVGEGSGAVISTELGGEKIERRGQVSGLLGDLDPVGRMARLLVSVDDPFDLNREATLGSDRAAPLPLLIGSYVKVEINTGVSKTDLVEVPRTAVFEGNKIYVFEPDWFASMFAGVDGFLYPRGTLRIREVAVDWTRQNTLLTSKGLAPGDLVVVSRIPSPLPGMKLRSQLPMGDYAEPARDVRVVVPAAANPTDRPVSGAAGQAAAARQKPHNNGKGAALRE